MTIPRPDISLDFFLNFQKQRLSNWPIFDMQVADIACALTQAAIELTETITSRRKAHRSELHNSGESLPK